MVGFTFCEPHLLHQIYDAGGYTVSGLLNKIRISFKFATLQPSTYQIKFLQYLPWARLGNPLYNLLNLSTVKVRCS